jgi:hypothetical protein
MSVLKLRREFRMTEKKPTRVEKTKEFFNDYYVYWLEDKIIEMDKAK